MVESIPYNFGWNMLVRSGMFGESSNIETGALRDVPHHSKSIECAVGQRQSKRSCVVLGTSDQYAEVFIAQVLISDDEGDFGKSKVICWHSYSGYVDQ